MQADSADRPHESLSRSLRLMVLYLDLWTLIKLALADCFAHQHAQHGLQLDRSKWLGKKYNSSGRETVCGKLWILFRGHHHHRSLIEALFSSHIADEFRSGNMRHDYIEYRGGEL